MNTLRILFLFIVTLTAGAQNILFPAPNTVLYTGDKIPICWKTRGFGNDVWIHMYDPSWQSGTTIFIGMMEADDGEFQWTVSKGLLAQTNLTLMVFYSGVSGSNLVATIPVTVLPGPRPSDIPLPTIAPASVPVSIRKVVSIEWLAKTNHTYQVKASSNLTNWTVVAEGQSPDTNATALFYEDQKMMFFKVEDTTPLRP